MTTIKKRVWTGNFLQLSFVHFIIFMIFYTLLTTMPLYVIQELERSAAEGGLAVSAMFIAAILIRPFSGSLLEHFGKKNVMIATIIIFALTTFGYIWADHFTSLILLRFIHGLSFGVLSTATPAIATTIVPKSRQGEGLGYFMMFMNLAMVLGPFAGLTFIQFSSFTNLFILLSFLMIVGVLCAFFVNDAEEQAPSPSSTKKKMSLNDIFEGKVVPISVITAIAAFSYAGILSFISVYAHEIGLGNVSGYFFVVFALAMIITRPSLGRLFDQRGPTIVLLPCLSLFAIGLVVLSFSNSTFFFLLSAAIIGVGYGSLMPFMLSLVALIVPAHRNSHATATFLTIYDTGIALGSFALGAVVAYTGYALLYGYSAVLVLLVTFILSYVLQRMEKSNKEEEATVKNVSHSQ